MLLLECQMAKVTLKKETIVKDICKMNDQYVVTVNSDSFFCESLIIATGGLISS